MRMKTLPVCELLKIVNQKQFRRFCFKSMLFASNKKKYNNNTTIGVKLDCERGVTTKMLVSVKTFDALKLKHMFDTWKFLQASKICRG